MRRILTALIVVAWLAVPAAGAWWVVSQARDALDTPTPVVWVPATAAGDAVSEPAVIVPEWDTPGSLLASAWAGLVQRVLVAPGDVIETGTPIAVVGGVTRLAAATSVPFGRPLTSGDKGEDVEALNAALNAMGLPSTVGDTFGTDTRTGVRRLAASLGAGDESTFDPGWILFLPVEKGVASSVDLTVAAAAPPPGTPVLTLTPTLVSARIVPPQAIVDDGATAPLGQGSGTGPVDIDEALSFTDLSRDSVLIVEDTVAGTVAADGALSGGTLAAVAKALPAGTRLLQVTLRSPLPDGTVSVPAASVVTGPDGTMCVLTRASGSTHAVPVTISDSYVDVATVTPQSPGVLSAGASVWVAPPAAARESCRSS